MEKKYVLKKDYPFCPFFKKGYPIVIDRATSNIYLSGSYLGKIDDPEFNFDEWIEEVRQPLDGWVALKVKGTDSPWIKTVFISPTKEDCQKKIDNIFKDDSIPVHIKEVQ